MKIHPVKAIFAFIFFLMAVHTGCKQGGKDFYDRASATPLATITGELDTSFGSAGKLIIPIGGDVDTGRAVALQKDGKIIIAGYTGDSAYDFAVVRIK